MDELQDSTSANPNFEVRLVFVSTCPHTRTCTCTPHVQALAHPGMCAWSCPHSQTHLHKCTRVRTRTQARSPSERGAAVSGNIAAEFDAGDNPRLNKVSANGRR